MPQFRSFPAKSRAWKCSRVASAACGKLNRDEGTNLLEYAIVVILFFSLLFGIAGFGHMLYAYQYVNHAAKSAARFAIVNGANCNSDAAYGKKVGSCMAPITCSTGSCSVCSSGCAPATASDITNYVQMITPSSILFSKVTVTPTWNPSDSPTYSECGGASAGTPSSTNSNIGCTVQVNVQYSYDYIFPLLGTKTLNLQSTAQMVIAH